jgi:hypothetical protein
VNQRTIQNFRYFSSWIKSEHCINSRKQVLDNLKSLYELLDDEAELALQPGYFMKYKQSQSRQSRPENEDNRNGDESFEIIGVSPKHVSPDDRVFVFGNAFSKKAHTFYIGNKIPVTEHRINNNNKVTQVEIPNKEGTYDIYAEFDKNQQLKGETLRIVIHVEDSKLEEVRATGGFIQS